MNLKQVKNKEMKNLQQVTDVRTLKAMERAGHVTLLPETGTKIGTLYGGLIKCTYIDKGSFLFIYKKSNYTTKYVSGSFFPYVFRVIK